MLYDISSFEKVYQERTVLRIPRLQIEEGQIYSLIGANGSGKTTLLSILAFLEKQTRGQISFRSQNISSRTNLNNLRRQVVLVDQYPIMFSQSVYKNLEFGLKVRKVPKRERCSLIIKALEMVGMQDFKEARGPDLSGGETKRVALARALVVKPKVLLCDEPTANVDSENRESIFRILETINRQYGISVIFSTHNWAQGEKLAHHTLRLCDGQISDVPIVNVYSASDCHVNGSCQFVTINQSLVVELPGALLLSSGEKYSSGMRVFIDPAKILLKFSFSLKQMPGRFRGEIKKIVKKKNQVQVDVESDCLVSVLLSEEMYRENPPLVGQKVELMIPPEAVSVLS